MAELGRALREQRGFVLATIAVAVLRFIPGRVPGATETWATIFALWLAGVVVAAWRHRAPARPSGHLAAALGAQNLAIQAAIVVPGILVGTTRMILASDSAPPAAFSSNAVGTLIVLPLASLIVLTFAAMPPALGLRWLLRRLAVLLSIALLPASVGVAQECPPSTVRLDHVAIVTCDLDTAIVTEPGFAIPGESLMKPGSN